MIDRLEPGEARTDRLLLSRPNEADLDELFAISSDPRLWRHFPSGRHTDPSRTEEILNRWIAGWESDGLGMWIARRAGSAAVIGYGGCSLLGGVVWNLGYRFAANAHGHGYATELARKAVDAAERARPGLAVGAYLLEHNLASAGVARKLGMDLVYRGLDAGNPDPTSVRLIFASRPLSPEELAAFQH